MSGGTPGTPNPVKGAIVGLDPDNPVASIVVFQYNPAELHRELTPAYPTDGGEPVDTTLLTGPPKETFSIELTISATDQLNAGSPVAGSAGIYPQLAALEMLTYPKTLAVLKDAALEAAGSVEMISTSGPLILFVWGVKRVVPVKIISYAVRETMNDPHLNPIQATVDLSMQALTYRDFDKTDVGYSLFLVYQGVKEAMATLGSASNASALGGAKL